MIVLFTHIPGDFVRYQYFAGSSSEYLTIDFLTILLILQLISGLNDDILIKLHWHMWRN